MADAFALGAAASVATLLLGLGRGKLAAVFLGPVGMGVVGDITQATQLMFVPITMLAGPALVSVIAKAHKADDAISVSKAHRTVMTALPLAGVVGILAAVSVGPLLVNLDGASAMPLLLIAGIAMATKGIYGVQRQILIAMGDIRRATLLSLVNSTLVLMFVTLGVLVLGVKGYLAFPIMGFAIAILMAARLLRKSASGVDWRLRPYLDAALLKESFRIGIVVLINDLTMQGTLVAIRWLLTSTGGQAQSGLFHAGWAVGNIHINTLLMALGQFVFPRYAAATDTAELTKEVESATAFMLRFTPPIIFLALGTRDFALRILFSEEFLACGPMLSCLLITALWKVVHWNQSGPLLYRGHVRAAVFLRLLGTTTLVGLCWILVPQYGLLGVGIASIYNAAQSTVASALALHVTEGVPFQTRHLMVSSAWAISAGMLALGAEMYPLTNIVLVAVGTGLSWHTGLHRWLWRKVRARLGRKV